MPATADHDSLARRLTVILRRLNEGQKLVPQALAAEFGVHLRTIQRDLSERFDFLELEKVEGGYVLPAAYLGRLAPMQADRGWMTAAHGALPSRHGDLMREWLRSLLDEGALMVNGLLFESFGHERQRMMRQLDQAIRHDRVIDLDGQMAQGPVTLEAAHPYRCLRHLHAWCLALVHEGQPQLLPLERLLLVSVRNESFVRDPVLDRRWREGADEGRSGPPTEVVLEVGKPIAHHFLRRKLIAAQTVQKHLKDGGLIVSGRLDDPDQILPVVRYWMPNMRIVRPRKLQITLEQEMRGYLGC